MKIYATGTNVATHNSKIQIKNDRNATPHVDQSPISKDKDLECKIANVVDELKKA